MSFVRVMVHAVWATKNRAPIITKTFRPALYSHIKANSLRQNLYIDAINGYADHIHILFGLNADVSISKTIQLIKGESSFWINQNRFIVGKFAWADKYYAASVSESNLEAVRAYINKQEEHHSKKSFTQECEEFMRIYGFKDLLS